MDDLFIINDEEGANNDDDYADSIIDCEVLAGDWKGNLWRGRTEVLLCKHLVLFE